MKRLLALILTITSPIWFIPVFAVSLFIHFFSSVYEYMLDFVNEYYE